MLLKKNLFTLLISLVLTLFISSAASAPTDSGLKTKRTLFPRASGTKVEMGHSGSAFFAGPDLYTDNLRTCFGIAVTGTGGPFTRFLVHIPATKVSLRSQWPEFQKELNKEPSLTDKKGYISVPDPCNSQYKYTDDDLEMREQILEDLKEKVKGMTGSVPTLVERPVKDHPTGEQGTMVIKADGTVLVEGNQAH